jgi:gamma-glutamylcyclotransferase (GGCT)/AIG2-like uncharacterized protein YtfP
MTLFVYGTLLDLDVMRLVCGQTFPGIAAHLDDFACRKVTGEKFPAIVPAQGGRVTGLLYSELSRADLVNLDNYEGDLYERCQVMVSCHDGTKRASETYVLRVAYRQLLSNEKWCLGDFSGEIKEAYIKSLK